MSIDITNTNNGSQAWGDLRLSISEAGEVSLRWGKERGDPAMTLGVAEGMYGMWDLLPPNFVHHEGYCLGGWNASPLETAVRFAIWQGQKAEAAYRQVEEWFWDEVSRFKAIRKAKEVA